MLFFIKSDFSLSPYAKYLNTSSSDLGAPIEHHLELKSRQDSPPTTDVSTRGHLNGNGILSRTAEPGIDCRVDTKNAV